MYLLACCRQLCRSLPGVAAHMPPALFQSQSMMTILPTRYTVTRRRLIGPDGGKSIE